MGGDVDIAVVGAGAAGLMAAIQAGRAAGLRRVALVDGAARLGAKIRISGGGRCNVTHDVVSEHDFAGASPHAIRKVLRQLDVEETRAFFESIGVALKREETGKLFPVTDRATTVLDALFEAVERGGATLMLVTHDRSLLPAFPRVIDMNVIAARLGKERSTARSAEGPAGGRA